MDDYPRRLWWHEAALLAGTKWCNPSVAGMAQAAKLGNDWSLYYLLHPPCLWEKGSKKPRSFKAVLLLSYVAHVGFHMGVKNEMLKQQHWFFSIRLKIKNSVEYILWREYILNSFLYQCKMWYYSPADSQCWADLSVISDFFHKLSLSILAILGSSQEPIVSFCIFKNKEKIYTIFLQGAWLPKLSWMP